MISPEEALELVLRNVGQGEPVRAPLAQALGRVLAEDVVADRDYPPFARAMMDGYAVRRGDIVRPMRVVGMVAAGQDPDAMGLRIGSGECIEIMTGAPCPAGTDAVIPRERVQSLPDGCVLPGEVESRSHVAPKGSECRSGALVLGRGAEIGTMGVAALATVGRDEVLTLAPPSMSIFTTGNEIVPSIESGPRGAIRDSNGPMLVTQARAAGAVPLPVRHVEDSARSLAEALTQSEASDMVVVSGGVSAGRFDCVAEAIRMLGARTVFHKVAQKPGKPLLFALLGRRPIFGLPGNPLAAHLCFHRYVALAVRRRMGRGVLGPAGRGRLLAPLEGTGERALFSLVRVEEDGAVTGGRGVFTVRALRDKGSADVFATANANAYVYQPAHADGVEGGAEIDFEWLGAPR